MGCQGLHCGGCGHGGRGGAVVLVVIVAAVLISATRKTLGKAAGEVGHVLAVALEVAVITVAAAAGLGLAYLVVRAGIRVQRWRAGRVRETGQIDQYSVEVIEDDPLAAIEPPRPRADPYLIPDQEAIRNAR